ncbi:hypothetical protein [Nocardioides speluncae]|uniref:hypothetical protein n=1 Tax=Nocardioides speluncae TaxID=2670337 RepID=UPI000D685A79|nr:hypothetical protein [Nocardioides speluncae]
MTNETTARLEAFEPIGDTGVLVRRMLALALRGLAAAYDPKTGSFAQTVRGVTGPDGVQIRAEGRNLRYTAIAALGLSKLPIDVQRDVLHDRTAAEIASIASENAVDEKDPGAIALAAWADAEINDVFPDKLFMQLRTMLKDGRPLPTVDTAWMATAAVAAAELGNTDTVLDEALALLLRYQGGRGIFPHHLPPNEQPRWRAHVGSFADQAYPIQALARAAVLKSDGSLLAAANRTAARICELQGDHGQWWWHYDSRDGSVVEGFPVYSVHQHATAPMVLFDLLEAGGDDRVDEIALGVRWLETHPEAVEELISDRWGLIWRKIGRHEPPKAARALGAVSTAVRAGAQLPGLDRALPPGKVDHECRPYELGWLLYAWDSQLAPDRRQF